jgi:hypothetical protein
MYKNKLPLDSCPDLSYQAAKSAYVYAKKVLATHQLSYQTARSIVPPGSTNSRGILSTVDLLIKVV